MSTTSLYQTHRPSDWGQVIGQDEIVKTLKNQLEGNSISHAYLFFGSRGLGKTTTARILANKLQIEPEDLYEIDAASNRGIDDIREIRDGVKVRPFRSPYKMYLIDEVHMLTKEAFNALLKTLEEPPSYVIFVLATTELHKVPDTIKSRVQVYTFKQPDIETLSKFISEKAHAEGVDMDTDSSIQLARLADGSFRDALGQLQKFIANPDSLESSTVSHMLVENLLIWLGSLRGGTEAKSNLDFVDLVMKTMTPKILFNQIVVGVNNKVVKEMTQKGDSLAFWQHSLEIVLSCREYATSDNVTVARAGLVLMLGKLSSVKL